MSFLDQFEDRDRLSVSAFTRRIKSLLEGNVPPCWVQGEVSNLRRQASGHIYFTLKDEGSQLPTVMFRGDAAGLAFNPQDGMEVEAYGEISVFEPYGRYQLIVRALEEGGAGRRYRAFEKLKSKLKEEGLFDAERKQAIPAMPRRIGLVTSPTGAAAQDFIRILKRRQWQGRLTVIPSKVQGQGAADEIAEALALADNKEAFDLVALCRGGGSSEDLWCFNEEIVARAVAACRIPVISAVGHETDVTLVDFVADLRAETPSGAAELISTAYLEQWQRLTDAAEAMERNVEGWLAALRQSLELAGQRLLANSPRSRLEKSLLQLDDVASRMTAGCRARIFALEGRRLALANRFAVLEPSQRLLALRHRLSNAWRNARQQLDQQIGGRASRLETMAARLAGLSPSATLQRGYALLETKEGKVISSVNSVPEAAPLQANLRDGQIWLRRDPQKEKDR